MKSHKEIAYAKINLTLDVLGKRPDGYHEMAMVMQSVSLADTVTFTQCAEPGLTLSSNLGFLPGTDKNIAAIAARVFAERTGVSLDGLHIHLDKHIPVCAGTAGGSSDGAAVLRGLNLWFQTGLSLPALAHMGEAVGSDVPYCVLGCTALAEGRGEAVRPLPALPKCHIVLCKPNFSISTPELFRRIDEVKLRYHPDTAGVLHALEEGDLAGISRRIFNVFEQVLPASRRMVVEEIKNTLLDAGALGASMSGTGPTVFGIFEKEGDAQAVCDRLRCTYPETFLTHNV